jgi:hypothetical protein
VAEPPQRYEGDNHENVPGQSVLIDDAAPEVAGQKIKVPTLPAIPFLQILAVGGRRFALALFVQGEPVPALEAGVAHPAKFAVFNFLLVALGSPHGLAVPVERDPFLVAGETRPFVGAFPAVFWTGNALAGFVHEEAVVAFAAARWYI